VQCVAEVNFGKSASNKLIWMGKLKNKIEKAFIVIFKSSFADKGFGTQKSEKKVLK
jgi:hypothetical protein